MTIYESFYREDEINQGEVCFASLHWLLLILLIIDLFRIKQIFRSILQLFLFFLVSYLWIWNVTYLCFCASCETSYAKESQICLFSSCSFSPFSLFSSPSFSSRARPRFLTFSWCGIRDVPDTWLGKALSWNFWR